MGGRGTGVEKSRERIHRVNEFWQLVIDNSGKSKEEIIARFNFKYGTCRRTTLDYLKVLVLNNKIKEVDGCLFRE